MLRGEKLGMFPEAEMQGGYRTEDDDLAERVTSIEDR